MPEKKNMLAIIGSAADDSANSRLVDWIVLETEPHFNWKICPPLKTFPHFDPDLSVGEVPQLIQEFRQSIEYADGVLICTPEYVLSIPAGLKNILEWCVATTLFAEKPLGLITASAGGATAHAEVKLILQTLGARFTITSTLLIPGVKGKVNSEGRITDSNTKKELDEFVTALKMLMRSV